MEECTKGHAMLEQDRFCAFCGSPKQKFKKICPRCKKKAYSNMESFCTADGTKLVNELPSEKV